MWTAGEIHWSAMIVGVVVAAVLLVRTITGRAKKARKGYAMVLLQVHFPR